jgi:hypothetical protein
MHFRAMFDSDFIGVWSLDGGDKTVTITRVEAGSVGGQKGKKKDRKAIIHFREFSQPMACNVTNAKAIAGLYGADVSQWAGKRVTLFPTTTAFGGETVECIRVRPTIPRGESSGQRPDREPPEETRKRQQRAAAKEHPIAKASTGEELLDAIRATREEIAADEEGKRWAYVLKRATELEVSEDACALAMRGDL